MSSAGSERRRPSVLGIGVIAAVLTAFSAILALVSVALYRAEREAIDGGPNAEVGEHG